MSGNISFYLGGGVLALGIRHIIFVCVLLALRFDTFSISLGSSFRCFGLCFYDILEDSGYLDHIIILAWWSAD